MDQKIKGIPLGILPEIGQANIVYKTPDQYISQGFNQIITLAKDSQPGAFVMTFWNWARDSRYKTDIRGTWVSREVILTSRHLRAFRHIELGVLA